MTGQDRPVESHGLASPPPPHHRASGRQNEVSRQFPATPSSLDPLALEQADTAASIVSKDHHCRALQPVLTAPHQRAQAAWRWGWDLATVFDSNLTVGREIDVHPDTVGHAFAHEVFPEPKRERDGELVQ